MELRREEETFQTTVDNQSEVYVQQNEWQPNNSWDMQYDSPYVSAAPRLTKKEFYKHSVMRQIRGNINGAAIALYISCAVTFLVYVVMLGDIFGMVDVMLLLGLGLGIQIGKSRVCSGIMLGYAILNMIYVLISTGRVGGYWIVIAAVYALIGTCKFQKAWKEYSISGTYPGI